MYAFE